jgi:hypothetical protein
MIAAIQELVSWYAVADVLSGDVVSGRAYRSMGKAADILEPGTCWGRGDSELAAMTAARERAKEFRDGGYVLVVFRYRLVCGRWEAA